jgi:hypothetical protein
VNLQAQPNPHLEALTKDYKGYTDDLKSGTGHFLDVTGQKIRDAREGGKRSLAESESFRGIGSSNRAAQYEEGTLDELQRGLTDAGIERERTYGAALQGGVGVYGAPADLALREKGLGLDALREGRAAQQQQYDQQRNASLDKFSQFLELLQQQQSMPSAPVYTGSSGGGGAAAPRGARLPSFQP